MTKIALVLALVLAAPGCGSNNTAADAEKPRLEPERDAPGFELANVAGGSLNAEALKGKVTIVDVWATWCAPCIKEIPMFNKIHEKYQDKDVQMLAVTVQSGSLEEVQPYVKEFNMKYPVLMGTDELEEGLGGIIGFPTTFVIGKDWKIYKKYLGNIKDKEKVLESNIEELLAR
jgi:thiol-disulfide isomerase/thioredoxin